MYDAGLYDPLEEEDQVRITFFFFFILFAVVQVAEHGTRFLP
jgi:hypothetical protein